MPVGTILAYSGSLDDIPNGWHLCDGTDGTPNLLDNRFLEGGTTIGISKDPGLPNIIGSYPHLNAPYFAYTGPFYVYGAYKTAIAAYGVGTDVATMNFDASRSNPIYGASSTVQPRSYTVLYIIKIK